MPYIKQELRETVDIYVDVLADLNLSKAILLQLLQASTTKGGYVGYDITGELQELAQMIHENVLPDGRLNYMLFKYAKYHITPSYNNYKDFISLLMEVSDTSTNPYYKDEFRETAEWVRLLLLVPYEITKRRENGDV